MTRALSNDVLSQLSSESFRYMFMVDLQLDSGSLAFNSSLSSHNYDGKTFYAAGNLGSVSAIEEGSNLNPASCTVSLSGIDSAVLSAVLAEETLNRRGLVYIALLDQDNQIVSSPFIYFDGLMETPSVTFGRKATISISLKDRLAIWNRDKTELWTHSEQETQFPGDFGLEFVNGIANKEITWPAAKWFEVN